MKKIVLSMMMAMVGWVNVSAEGVGCTPPVWEGEKAAYHLGILDRYLLECRGRDGFLARGWKGMELAIADCLDPFFGVTAGLVDGAMVPSSDGATAYSLMEHYTTGEKDCSLVMKERSKAEQHEYIERVMVRIDAFMKQYGICSGLQEAIEEARNQLKRS